MEEQLITFETAKLAKEKGLLKETYKYYTTEGELSYLNESEDRSYYSNVDADELNPNHEDFDKDYLDMFVREFDGYGVYSQSLLQKWLRSKEIHISIYWIETGFDFGVKTKPGFILNTPCTFPYYEEALEEALQFALNLL